MPPPLALAFCAIFIILMLRLERKQAPDVTRALWIPTIWMLYSASKPIAVWFRIESTAPDAGSPMDQVFLIGLMLAALAILARRRSRWMGAMKENPWVLALIVFMFISVIWSDIPGTSLKRWIRELHAVLMSLAVLSEPSPRQAMESLLRRVTYILIPLSMLLIKYFPIYGVEYGRWSGEQMWIGVTQQKNGMALLCIISAIFILWSLFRRWQGETPPVWKYQAPAEMGILILTLYLLGGPSHSLFYSATSSYAFTAGLIGCSWVYFREKAGKRVKASVLSGIIALFIVFGVASVFVGGSGIKFFASSAGRDTTLTGRTEVWTSLLPVVLGSPIVGRGFGGFWTSKTRELYKISGAHNGYLDVLLGIGFSGLILVSMFLMSSCRRAHRELTQDRSWGLLWLCYLVVAVVHNIGESSIDSFTALLTAILLFMTVAATRKRPAEIKPEEDLDEAFDEALDKDE